MRTPGFSLLASLLAAGAVLSAPAIAQVKPNATAADVGLYSGPDRLSKLVEGGKKEKELNLYTAAQSDDMGGAGGRLREEIRGEGERMACELGKGAAARRRRSARRPQHRGRGRDQRPRNGIAAPRKRPATG